MKSVMSVLLARSVSIVLCITMVAALSMGCSGSKGNWSASDRAAMRAELDKSMAEFVPILGAAKTEMVINCCMKEVEANYSGPITAGLDYDGMMKIGESCTLKVMGE